MKRVIFYLVLFFCFELCGQSISIGGIGANSVIISYNISEPLQVTLYENDTVYYEDFSLMPNTSNTISGDIFVYNNFLWRVPYSYLRILGAKVQHIASYGGTGIKMDKSSKFQTPNIDISKTHNNGEYSYSLSVDLEKLSGTKKMYIQNDLGEDVYTPTATSFFIDSTRTLPNFYLRFFSDTTSNASREYLLKKVVITIPQEYCNKRIIDLSATDNSYTINDLSPNTKYVVTLGNDTLVFETLREKILDSISNVTTNSADIYFSDNSVGNKKLKIINKGNGYTFADDLFISEFAYGNDYNAIELYNGTGKDICLKDYRLTLYGVQSFAKTFSERDTIKHNSTVVVYNAFDIHSEIENSGEFHYTTSLFYGHKPIVLLYNNDTIDIFGNVNELSQQSSTGWSCTDSNENTLNTARYDLRRNSFVDYGIKHNPSGGFPTLCREWSGSNSTAEDNFRNFGLHSMDGVISREAIADTSVGSEDEGISISLEDGFYKVSNLTGDSYYVAYLISEDESVIYGYKGFLTKGTTQRTASGTWSDNNWTAGEPKFNTVVEIPSNIQVTVEAGSIAKGDSLIIKSGASFKNEGDLNIKNFAIEKTFTGYNNNATTGWYLMGMPIVVEAENQNHISQSLSANADNDNIDLYFWQEDYLENDMQGMWVNYKAYDFAEPFFEQTKGYLVAYANDTMDRFTGKINDKFSYTLLDNATLSGVNSDFGWHLVTNPYTFPISLSQLTRNNISVPNILNTTTGNYIPLTSGEMSIAPFEGFFVQVTDANNSLLVKKNIANTNNNSLPYRKNDDLGGGLLTFSIIDGTFEDRFSMAFDSESGFGLDWQTDSRKLRGFGNVAEIFANFNEESFAINHIPSTSDSLMIDLRCVIKRAGNYAITFNEADISPYDKVSLVDRQTGEELADFSVDSFYSFEADESMAEDRFLLKFSRVFSCDNVLPASQYINIMQEDNKIEAFSNEDISLLTLYSIDGKQISQTTDNKIIVQQKGIFFLTITTPTHQKTFKIIVL